MKFYCDGMLGKLAKYLRILGFDCTYSKNLPTVYLHPDADQTPSFFLTKKQGATNYPNVIVITSDSVQEQLKEIKHLIQPFIREETIMSRCILCNTLLVDIQKDGVENRVPEFIFHTYESFRICPTCKKIYWSGSHTKNMYAWIQELFLCNV